MPDKFDIDNSYFDSLPSILSIYQKANKMDVKNIISKFNNQTDLADLIGKGQSTIAYWVKKEQIPQKWHKQLLELASERGINLSIHDFMPPPNKAIPISAESVEVFAKHKGELQLGGASVDCYVLNTGERVISMRSAVQAIAKVDS